MKYLLKYLLIILFVLLSLLGLVYIISKSNIETFNYKKSNENINIKNDMTLVTCYYNVKNKYCKNSECTDFDCKCIDTYKIWLDNFLNYVAYNIPVVIFTSPENSELLDKYKSDKCLIYYGNIKDFKIYKYKKELEKQYEELEKEKDKNNINLYFLRNQKIYFLDYVMRDNPFKSNWFAWVDIGTARENRLNSLFLQSIKFSMKDFDNDRIKFTNITNVHGFKPNSDFKGVDEDGISIVNKTNDNYIYSMSGSLFFGGKDKLIQFAIEYNKLFDKYISKNIYIGNEQNIYSNIAANNPELVELIYIDHNNWAWQFQTNHWIYIYNHLISKNIPKVVCTPELVGGLGNRLFQIISTFGMSQLKNGIIILSNNFQVNNYHSQINYFDNIFKNFLISDNRSYEHIIQGDDWHDKEKFLQLTPQIGNILVKGYIQTIIYFHKYRDQIFKLINLPEPSINGDNKAFLHLRLGDYLGTEHFVDLKKYYERSVEYIINKHGQDVHFIIFSLDSRTSEEYAKNLKLKNYSIDSNTNELQNLSDMKSCKIGGICANSTFSWWGAYLNQNKDITITLPKRWRQRHKKDSIISDTLCWEDTIVIDCD